MNSPVFYSASRSNIVPSCSILPSLSWVGTSCKYLLILCLCTVMVHSFCVCVFALWRESCLFAFFCDCLLWDLCFLARCKAMFLICVCFFVCLLCNFFLFCVKKGVCNMQWGWPCAFHCCRLFSSFMEKNWSKSSLERCFKRPKLANLSLSRQICNFKMRYNSHMLQHWWQGEDSKR